MTEPSNAARAAVEALVLEIEALVRKGGVRREEAFDLLQRAIDRLRVEDRSVLRPVADKFRQGPWVKRRDGRARTGRLASTIAARYRRSWVTATAREQAQECLAEPRC